MARQIDARMTPRQRCFVSEYLVDCNGKQAAIRAGYSPKTAAHEAWKLLKRRPNIALAIKGAMAAQEARTRITADQALEEIARIAFSDVRRLFESKDGVLTVKDIATLSDADAAAIARIVVTKDRIDIRLHDKRAALLDLARHLGLVGKRMDSQPGFRAKDELPAREVLAPQAGADGGREGEKDMTGMTWFTLWQRKSGAMMLGLSCDEEGIFLAGEYAVVTPITDATGRRLFRARSIAEINVALSAAYGRAVDFSDRMAGLRLAARYLTAGDWALAKIAAVHLRVPDLPDAAAVSRLRKAEELLRFNPNHRPAGTPDGGQFAPSDQNTINVADSSADDITQRKFDSDEEAARSALKHFYSASRRAGAEYGGVIYRNRDGTYGITAPTAEKDGNNLCNSSIRWSDVPDGTQPVASYHTHLRTDTPSGDEYFSPSDRYIAQTHRVKSYIATPLGRLKVYDGATRSEADLGPL